MKECTHAGSAGQILINAFCKDCDTHHFQWKFPCDCENGKVTVEPLGYKLCDKCNGRGFK